MAEIKCKIIKTMPCVLLPAVSLAIDIAEQSKLIKPNTLFIKRYDKKYSHAAQGNFSLVSIDPEQDYKKFWACYDRIRNESMYMETYIFNQLIELEELPYKLSACADGLQYQEGDNEFVDCIDEVAVTLGNSIAKLFGTKRRWEIKASEIYNDSTVDPEDVMLQKWNKNNETEETK